MQDFRDIQHEHDREFAVDDRPFDDENDGDYFDNDGDCFEDDE